MVVCPECGASMVLRETTKYTYNNGRPRKFFGCSRFPNCQAAHGAHPDGKPMGVPANAETKKARITAHAVFDAHWKKLGLSKTQGYKLFQDIMDMSAAEAHIANFDRSQCETLVRRIAALKEVNMSKLTGVTFSGPDSNTSIEALLELQKTYPFMEVGVLWSTSRAGQPRYADKAWIEKASELGLNFSLHLCGKVARDMVEGTTTPEIPGKPRRIQINCNGMRGLPGWFRAFNSIREAAPSILELIIQTCDYTGAYWVGLARGEGFSCTPLFDKSGGKGESPTEWPKPLPHTHCGFAGGLGFNNVEDAIRQVQKMPGETFWIDMESKVRINDVFDLNEITKVCIIAKPYVDGKLP